METGVYRLSNGFHRRLSIGVNNAEPLLIVDRDPNDSPQRIFLVRYVMGEGGGGESKRPIFKDELTGYDYDSQVIYPTQRTRLELLQSTLELSIFAVPEAHLSRARAENVSTKEQRPIKAIAF
jgi:hypothetical protein